MRSSFVHQDLAFHGKHMAAATWNVNMSARIAICIMCPVLKASKCVRKEYVWMNDMSEYKIHTKYKMWKRLCISYWFENIPIIEYINYNILWRMFCRGMEDYLNAWYQIGSELSASNRILNFQYHILFNVTVNCITTIPTLYSIMFLTTPLDLLAKGLWRLDSNFITGVSFKCCLLER